MRIGRRVLEGVGRKNKQELAARVMLEADGKGSGEEGAGEGVLETFEDHINELAYSLYTRYVTRFLVQKYQYTVKGLTPAKHDPGFPKFLT